MATKEQERKVLTKIEKMVLGLGVGSYIATAFEGCWEIARGNIENDFACSMKQKVEAAEEQLAEAKDTIQCRENELADKETEIIGLRKASERDACYMNELRERLKSTEETASKIIDERSELSVKCSQQETEILHLKARLYDLLCK